MDIDELHFGYIVDIPLNPFLLNDTMFFKQTVSMSPGDSLFLNYEHRCRFKGAADVIAWVGYPKIDYDSLYQSVFIPITNDEIIITEFVCKTGDRFTSEYIEILNRSSGPLSLKGIEVHDLTGHTSIDSHYVIGVDSMLVLAQSTSFHDDFPYVKNYIVPPAWRSLNNNEDQIVLANPISSTLCDLNYNSDWDIANDCAMQLVDTALDYRNALNWEISYDGSPGKFNTTERQLRHLSFYSEKDFFVHGDTVVFSIINDGYFPMGSCQGIFTTPVGDQIIDLPYSEPGDTIICNIDTLGLFIEGTNECTFSITGTPGLFPGIQ